MIRPALFGVVCCSLVFVSSTDATPARESSPGRYEGYSTAIYDGHAMTSQYVSMRDGTRLAIDIFRPAKGGVVASEKLPVLWMHTPYNRRNYRNGPTAANYPGKALELVGPRDCRFPIGTPGKPGFKFCRQPRHDDGPYCLHHARLCYAKARGGGMTVATRRGGAANDIRS